MIHIEQAVIVEGKYDKIKLSSVIDAVIIPTNGFTVFKDKEKLALIRYYAEKKGLIVFTDSDTAGFKIRNYIKGAVKNGTIINVYIPDIFGKEKRKTAPSKEGKLGVEGVSVQIILDAFAKAGITACEKSQQREQITRLDFYELGLSGHDNSSEKRKLVLKKLNLPELLTTTSMLEILNTMMSRQDFFSFIQGIIF